MEQLKSIGVEVDDDHIIVTLCAKFAKKKGVGLVSMIALCDVIREAVASVDITGKSANTNGESGASASGATTRSRSRRKPKEETDDGKDATEATDTDADAGKPARSRRRSGGEHGDAASSVQHPGDEDAGSTRRSRKREGSGGDDEGSGQSEPRRTRSRRKSEDAVEPEAEKPARRTRKQSTGISDEDLAKACSEAAEVVGHEVVTQVLEEDYSVSNVNEVPQKSRKEFMATLRKEMAD